MELDNQSMTLATESPWLSESLYDAPAVAPVWVGRSGWVVWLFAALFFCTGFFECTPAWPLVKYLTVIVVVAFFVSFRVGIAFRIPELYLLMGLNLWLWLSMLTSLYQDLAVVMTWYVAKIYIVVVLFMIRIDSLPRFRLCLVAYVLGVTGLALLGMSMGFSSIVEGGERMGAGENPNLFSHNVMYGAFAGLLIISLVGRLLRWGVYAFILMAIMAILGSGSRAPAAGLGLALLAYFLLEHIRHIRQNLLIFLPVAFVLIAIPIVALKVFPESPLIARLTHPQHNVALSDVNRAVVWPDVLSKSIRSPVVGYGMGSYRFLGAGTLAHTHTSVLELIFSAGYPALFLYLAMYAALAMRLRRLTRFFRYNPQIRKFLNAASAVLVGTVVGMLVATNFDDRGALFLFGALAGLTFRMEREARRMRWESPEFALPEFQQQPV